jgi:5-methylcytosine-specific restriction endonuclease McrA
MVKVYPDPLTSLPENNVAKPPKQRKETIPKAVREQVWIRTAGRQFEVQCPIHWCRNTITVFDFHVGHNIPEKDGGTLELDNLKPLCARCNLSMGSNYTIDAWNKLVAPEVTSSGCFPWFRPVKS